MDDSSSSGVSASGLRGWLPRLSAPTAQRSALFTLFTLGAIGLFGYGYTLPRAPFWRKASVIGGGSLLLVTGASLLSLSFKEGAAPLAPEVQGLRDEILALATGAELHEKGYIERNIYRVQRPDQVALYRSLVPAFGEIRAFQRMLPLTNGEPRFSPPDPLQEGQLAQI